MDQRDARVWSVENPRQDMAQRDRVINVRPDARELRPEPIVNRALAQTVLRREAAELNFSIRRVARELGISRMELMSIIRALQYDGSVHLFD